jgi:superfamily I DNA/RNA helicase
VRDTLHLLQSAGIPAINLEDYSGRPVDAVKVGTVKRAKGLEFKTVLLPRVRPEWINPAERDDEAHIIHRRELYVAMTRARDELWVGVCA